jgi:hypothetical protein
VFIELIDSNKGPYVIRMMVVEGFCSEFCWIKID